MHTKPPAVPQIDGVVAQIIDVVGVRVQGALKVRFNHLVVVGDTRQIPGINALSCSALKRKEDQKEKNWGGEGG